MTDKQFILAVLGDGEPHTLQDLLWRSLTERGHGLTVHSRVADLRRDGHDIRHTTIPGRQRGAASVYRLVGPEHHEQPPQDIPSDESYRSFDWKRLKRVDPLSEQREAPAPPAASRSSLNGSAPVPVGEPVAVTSSDQLPVDLVRAPQQLFDVTDRPGWA